MLFKKVLIDIASFKSFSSEMLSISVGVHIANIQFFLFNILLTYRFLYFHDAYLCILIPLYSVEVVVSKEANAVCQFFCPSVRQGFDKNLLTFNNDLLDHRKQFNFDLFCFDIYCSRIIFLKNVWFDITT